MFGQPLPAASNNPTTEHKATNRRCGTSGHKQVRKGKKKPKPYKQKKKGENQRETAM